MGKLVMGFSPAVLTLFQNSDWPGNIRELANVVERAVIVSKEPVIDIHCLPLEFRGELTPLHKADNSFENALNNCKKVTIANALQASGNNKSEAARRLGISRTYLFRLLKQFGLGET